MKNRFVLVPLLLSLAAAGQVSAAPSPSPALQVASPDWRDQILYFVMVDRFFDGNPTNSDQKRGEYDPADGAKYSGGDLTGLTAKLGYIKGLGATGVWITPPVANQWWDPRVTYGGYHGYWAENFGQVDRHLGNLDDYKALSAALHKNKMVLVQDIVANHTGNFFHMEGGVWSGNPGSVGVTKPTQPPFDLDDYTDPVQREAGIYHWTGNIRDYDNLAEAQDHQLSDLDDLNTENPVVRAALKDSYSFWIKTVGVDGFRIDTARYAPQEFWNDFHWSKDPKHPGIMTVAAAVGKKDFFTFGEDWESTKPLYDGADRTMVGFLGTPKAPGMGSVLNFPLQADIQSVFAKGRATELLTYRLQSQARIYPDVTRLVNFLDNHDMDRFLAGADKPSLRQALAFLLTIPGIPVINYGTEQGFTEARGAMFAAGWGSGGVDHFDAKADEYGLIAQLASVRRSLRQLSHGTLRVIRDAPAAGALVFETTWKGQTALVAFNTADQELLIDNLATGFKAGTTLTRQFSLAVPQRVPVTLKAGEQGLVHLTLGPRDAVVFSVPGTPNPNLTALPAPSLGEALYLRGTLPQGTVQPRLVIDGVVNGGPALAPDEEGQWVWKVVSGSLLAGTHRAVAWGTSPKGSTVVGAPMLFRTKPSFQTVASWDDPVGDDHGPVGAYVYPSHPTFAGQDDLKKVELGVAGNNLQVALTMAQPLTTGWMPVNGFDHAAFFLYLQVPGAGDGVTVMPYLNAEVPSGFVWNRLAFVEGWNSKLFTSAKAGPQSWGTPVSPAARVSVDKATNRILVTFEGAGLGNPAALTGTKVYLASWDWDGIGGLVRPLAPAPADYTYGGGQANGPKVMDDTPVLTVP